MIPEIQDSWFKAGRGLLIFSARKLPEDHSSGREAILRLKTFRLIRLESKTIGLGSKFSPAYLSPGNTLIPTQMAHGAKEIISLICL